MKRSSKKSSWLYRLGDRFYRASLVEGSSAELIRAYWEIIFGMRRYADIVEYTDDHYGVQVRNRFGVIESYAEVNKSVKLRHITHTDIESMIDGSCSPIVRLIISRPLPWLPPRVIIKGIRSKPLTEKEQEQQRKAGEAFADEWRQMMERCRHGTDVT